MLDLGLGEGNLGIVAAVEEVVEVWDPRGEQCIETGELCDVEVLVVVGAVVDEGDVAWDTRIADQTHILRMALKLIKDWDFRGVEIEAFEVVDKGRDGGDEFLCSDDFPASRGSYGHEDMVGAAAVHFDDGAA